MTTIQSLIFDYDGVMTASADRAQQYAASQPYAAQPSAAQSSAAQAFADDPTFIVTETL